VGDARPGLDAGDARTTGGWIMIRLWVVRGPGSMPEMPAPLLTGS